MLWTNYHCHTQYCDGRDVAEAFVKAAIEKKISRLGFSSHAPVPFSSEWNMNKADLPQYMQEIQQLKEKYRNEIEILMGLEVDYIKDVFEPQDRHIQGLPLDFKIASIHYLGYLRDGKPWSVDGPNELFDEGIKTIFGGSIKAFAKQFTEVSCEMMNRGGFDIVGHIDKMFQHGSRYHAVDEPWYKSLVGQLIETAKANGVIVEINTKSYFKLGFFYPHQYFFNVLKTFNLPVTINSDTHDPDKIDLAFSEAAVALKQAGIHHVVEFVNGNWEQRALTKKGVLV